MDQGTRIAFLRREKGISQSELADRIGLRQSMVSKIERGQRKLLVGEAKGIASALGVSLWRLLGESDMSGGMESGPRPVRMQEAQAVHGSMVPLLSLEACCGPFEEAVDEVIDWIPLASADYRESRYFLQAKGDSMSPTIADGERILVDRALAPRNGDIVVAVSEGESTIKRFFRYERRIELKPDNQAYPTIVMGPGDHLEVRGVVVCVQKQLRR